MNRRPSRWHIGALAVALLVVAVATGPPLGTPLRSRSTASDTLVDGTTDTITNLDPAGTYDFGTFTLDANVFEHLMDFKNGAKLEPSLATKCVAVGTAKTWRCTLRQGVKFSDGSDFDSADVKFSIDRVNNKSIKAQAAANSPSPLLGNLESVQTVGKYAVVFHLKSPQVTWPSVLATQCCFIVPSDTYSRDQAPLEHRLAGRHRPVQARQVHRGPAGSAAAERQLLGPEGEDAEPHHPLLREVVDDEARAPERRDRHGVPDVHADGAHLAHEGEGPQGAHGPRWPDPLPRLQREAGADEQPGGPQGRRVPDAAAGDRDAGVPQLRPAALLDAAGRVPVPHGRVRDAVRRAPSPAKAKAILAKAGLKTPFPIDIWWTPTHYGDASADEYAEIKRGLEAGGVFKVTLKSAEWAQYSAALGTQYNAFQLGWFPDYPDAENYVVPFYRSDTFTSNGYNNPTMEKLIKAELGAKNERIRTRRPQVDPGARGQGRVDHPVLAGEDDRRLEHQGERASPARSIRP